MAETRVRGQEVTMRLARNNVTEATITAFKEYNVTLKGKILEQGYLGETSMRYDDINDGCSGNFQVDAEGQDLFQFLEFIVARQQRQISVQNQRINATGRFTFPNGDTPKMLVKDKKFGEMPINIANRDAYVGVSFPFSAPVPKFITT